MTIALAPDDALLIVDVQRDFLPGGALAVPRGDEVVPVLNRYIALARRAGRPVYASRDWHPENHCSFVRHGGQWPPHCVAGTPGSAIAPALALPPDAAVVDKAACAEADAYSAFGGTHLEQRLREAGVGRLLVGGLATDYCVLNTVLDGLRAGFGVVVLADAVRAVELRAGDGARALEAMTQAGAALARLADFDT